MENLCLSQMWSAAGLYLLFLLLDVIPICAVFILKQMKYASKLSHTLKSLSFFVQHVSSFLEEAAVPCRELHTQREIILKAGPDLLSLFPPQSLPSLLQPLSSVVSPTVDTVA